MYVADSLNNRVQKFTATGGFVTKWGSRGTGDGQFQLPIGVAVGPDGSVYVVDRNNNRIQKFNGDGTFVAKWGTSGSGDGQFNRPWGIAVDASGNVIVADDNNSRIQKFSPDGTFLAKWGSAGAGPGQFDDPGGVAVNNATGQIYVADTGNDRIQIFQTGAAGPGPDLGATATAEAQAAANAAATATAAAGGGGPDAAATASANATATAASATATAAAAAANASATAAAATATAAAGAGTPATATATATATPVPGTTPEATAVPTPEPTPTPIPPYTGPTPVPPEKPAEVDVQEPVRPDLDVTATVDLPGAGSDASVKVLAGSSPDFMFLRISAVDRSEPPASEAGRALQERLEQLLEKLPPTLEIVSDRIFEITLIEPNGQPISGALARPVTISLPYTEADAARAGNVFNLRLLRYDATTSAWATLHTTIDFPNRLLTAQVTNLSVFAIGRIVSGGAAQPLQAPAAAPAGADLPNTGGLAPSAGLLVTLMLAGTAAVAVGGVWLRRRAVRAQVPHQRRSRF